MDHLGGRGQCHCVDFESCSHYVRVCGVVFIYEDGWPYVTFDEYFGGDDQEGLREAVRGLPDGETQEVPQGLLGYLRDHQITDGVVITPSGVAKLAPWRVPQQLGEGEFFLLGFTR